MKNIRCHSFRCARKLANLGKNMEGVGALVRAHGNIFLRWYFVSTNGVFWLKILLSKASNSTTVNFTEFSTISGKTSFCQVLHLCSLPSTEEGESEYFNLQRLLIEHSTQANVINSCVRCVFGDFQMY